MLKSPGIFYFVFAILSAVVPALKMAEVSITGFFGEYIYSVLDKTALGTAFFVFVMYTGAFPAKSAARKFFLPIRRQLSIIACILTFGHNIAYGKTYFVLLFTGSGEITGHHLAAALCSLVMILILIPLFITSFIGIRKKMKPAVWKKLQRLAYVFYALVYVHVILVNYRGMSMGITRNQINAAAYSAVFFGYLVCRIIKYISDNKSHVPGIFFIIMPVLTGMISGTTVILYGNTLQSKNEKESDIEIAEYEDGTFTASAFGYMDIISVSVVIENGRICDIYFSEYEDDDEYRSYSDYLLSLIKENPECPIDTISGATFSTGAVKEAYIKALEKAGK